MKPEELMIGDWVCAYNIYPNTKPLEKINLKIRTPLNSYGFIVATYGNRMAEYEDDDIEPIPITPEILERNGFHLEKFSSIDFFQYISEDGKVTMNNLSNTADRLWYCHVDNERFETIGGADIEYVHELQHILRLCKIEKEIEL